MKFTIVFSSIHLCKTMLYLRTYFQAIRPYKYQSALFYECQRATKNTEIPTLLNCLFQGDEETINQVSQLQTMLENDEQNEGKLSMDDDRNSGDTIFVFIFCTFIFSNKASVT